MCERERERGRETQHCPVDTAIAIAMCVGSSSLVSSCPADATIKNVLIIVVSTFNDNNNRQTQWEGERERGGAKYSRNKHINT